ncbi:hypothetical protein A6C57_17115 [Fibrella sp. ES10-3-2-2]|nr:hypothetical protein A6C57_17115 [Fibrella sp. ES10-3-2-2]
MTVEQDLLSAFDQSVTWPVPNKWEKQGWTFLRLANVPAETVNDDLTTADRTVAPAHLSPPYSQE